MVLRTGRVMLVVDRAHRQACDATGTMRGGYWGFILERARRPAVLLAVIMVVGLALRLYRIGTESISYEEYVCVGCLPADGFLDYMRALRMADPVIAPLVFALVYGWSRLFGESIEMVRFFFVLLGTLLIPLIYALAQLADNNAKRARTAGLIAALCVALSPVHVFHAQEVRHTTALTLLQLASVYCFLRAFREDWNGAGAKWWACALGVNFLLTWSHFFGPAIIAIETAVLLLYRRRAVGLLPAWFTGHALILVSCIPWVLSTPAQSPLAPPSLFSWRFIFEQLMIGDVFFLQRSAAIAFSQWRHVPPELASRIFAFINQLYPAYIWFGYGILAWGVVLAVRHWLAARRNTRADALRVENRLAGVYHVFLAAWLLLLPLVFVAMSAIWTPCFSNRYYLSSTFAAYLLLGGLLARCGVRVVRTGLVSVVIAFYAFNLFMFGSVPARTPWKAIANTIQDLGMSGAPIIADPYMLEMNFIFCNKPELASRRYELAAFPQNCERARALLSANEAPGVWLVDTRGIGPHMPGDVEKQLQSLSLHATRFRFLGARAVDLYYLEPNPLPTTVLEVTQRAELCKRAILLDPRDAANYIRLAELFKGDSARLAQEWRDVLDDSPYNVKAQEFLSQLAREQSPG